MKTKLVALWILAPLVGACAGYYMGALRQPVAARLAADATVPLEYLISVRSFSEVEQAKAVLDALAERHALQAQQQIAREMVSRTHQDVSQPSGAPRGVLTAIRHLETAITEFEGTGQEQRLLPTLLVALKHGQLYERWLDVYLTLLYQHPTHELVNRLADQAVLISRTVGREDELAVAFRHLDAIPPEFHRGSRAGPRMAGTSGDPRGDGVPHDPFL